MLLSLQTKKKAMNPAKGLHRRITYPRTVRRSARKK
jgi:hypothetical protein